MTQSRDLRQKGMGSGTSTVVTEALGQSEPFLEFQERLSRAAPINRPVLLIGERGTGKELAAARLHYLSNRWQAPMVALNCAALSPSLIESELFGYEKGAFTGALQRRFGRFESADRGTLFLDEIGSIPLEVQEKLIKLMIREMEDTLVEIKAACAGAMASSKKVQHQLDTLHERIRYWEEKAEIAVKKGRDNLAREALVEKRRYASRMDGLANESTEHNLLIEQYQNDIRQLEDKLKSARDKQRLLVQRHIHANRKRQAQEEIRRVDSSEAMFKFDELENRIERMEAEADLVNFGKKTALEAEFDTLGVDEEIEKELQALKTPISKPDETQSAD